MASQKPLANFSGAHRRNRARGQELSLDGRRSYLSRHRDAAKLIERGGHKGNIRAGPFIREEPIRYTQPILENAGSFAALTGARRRGAHDSQVTPGPVYWKRAAEGARRKARGAPIQSPTKCSGFLMDRA